MGWDVDKSNHINNNGVICYKTNTTTWWDLKLEQKDGGKSWIPLSQLNNCNHI